MKNLNLTIALVATLSASGLVLAEGGSATTATATDLWTALDVNQDGAISQEEASASDVVTEQWKLLDLNKDGQLSSEEFSLIDLSSS